MPSWIPFSFMLSRPWLSSHGAAFGGYCDGICTTFIVERARAASLKPCWRVRGTAGDFGVFWSLPLTTGPCLVAPSLRFSPRRSYHHPAMPLPVHGAPENFQWLTRQGRTNRGSAKCTQLSSVHGSEPLRVPTGAATLACIRRLGIRPVGTQQSNNGELLPAPQEVQICGFPFWASSLVLLGIHSMFLLCDIVDLPRKICKVAAR
ncbi:hypothetical protein MAPG_09212, partial [Magnaporthiopsis poae ATCC 64411]